MNDAQIDLVYAYLDGDIDDAAWQAAVAEHGDTLEQLLAEERAMRGQVKQLPRQSLPPALKASLQQIPQQAPSKKPSLLFPIVNTIVAVAASIMFVALAFFLTPGNENQDNNAQIGKMQLDHLESETTDQATPSKTTEEKPAALIRDDADEANEQVSQFAGQASSAEAKERRNELARKRKNDRPDQGQSVGRPGENPEHELADRITVEEIETESREGQAMKKAPHSNKRNIKPLKESAAIMGGAAVEDRTSTPADKPLSKGNRTAANSAAQAPVPAHKDQKARAMSDDGISEQEMQAALAEARDNTKNNQKVKQSSQLAKQGKNADKEEKNKQRQVMREALAVEMDQAKANEDAPSLNLKLGVEAKRDYLVLQIGMNEVSTAWFGRAILDMKLIGLDRAQKQVWLSVIKTHKINDERSELRSDGLPGPQVHSIVLESLGQRSPAIQSPLYSEMPQSIKTEATLDAAPDASKVDDSEP